MPYAAAPAKTEISATPSPTNAVAKAGFGKLHDWLAALLGTGGKPEHVYAAMKLLDPQALKNLAPAFSVAANALTIAWKDKDGVDLSADNPAFVAQRHATLGNGGFNLRKLEANVSLVISSGSTLGHGSGTLHPIYLYMIDNDGVQEPAASGTFQGESGIYTTVAEGGAGAADDPNVMYAANVRANKPGRLVAIAWSNQAAAGTWTAVPSETKQRPFHLERVGVTEDYKGGTVPYGFLLEDGSNVSRTTYAKLFAKVGTTWGVGDGATTFGLPDSRRRTSVGSGGTGTGTLGNAVGNTGGAETHTLPIAEMPAHTHTYVGTSVTASADIAGTQSNRLNGVTSSTGGGGAHNNMQPSMVVTKMIRWLGDI